MEDREVKLLRSEVFATKLIDLYDSGKLSADLMKVEKIDSEIKQKVAATLHLLQSNEDVLEQMRQSNPEAYLAVQHLIESMVGMAKKIGTDPETDMHKLQIQEQLDSAQNPEEEQQQGQEAQAPSGGGTGHLPSKDNPLHRRQTVYGPGAVRRYNSQDSRTKDASGEWKSSTQGVKDPGQNG